MNRQPVGFVGLGNMGLPMATNLLKAGFALHVFNRSPAKAAGLIEGGAVMALSPRALAEQTGLVVSMMADDAALDAVSLGADGILAGLPADGVHLDMSTVFPDTSRRLAQAYRERGIHFISAPVSGRPEHAAAAKLLIYPAGPAAAIDLCRPVLQALGQRLIVVGEDPPVACVMKLVANFVVFSLNEVLGEAFTFGEKAGLNSEPIREMLQILFPSMIIQLYARRIAESDFRSPGQPVKFGLKDVGHMRKLAEQVGASLPVAELAYRHLLAAQARGRGDLDVSAAVTVLREMAGLPARDLPAEAGSHN